MGASATPTDITAAIANESLKRVEIKEFQTCQQDSPHSRQQPVRRRFVGNIAGHSTSFHICAFGTTWTLIPFILTISKANGFAFGLRKASECLQNTR